jgi:two-component system aerobic respiration control sensor histidine kinase ArcB
MNALKYTLKGTITLRLENVNMGCVRILVKDTGIGVPANNQKKIFKLFGQDLKNLKGIGSFGSGLGLTIANLLAQMLSSGGKGIQLQSIVD